MSQQEVHRHHEAVMERSPFKTTLVWSVVAICLLGSLATVSVMAKARKQKPAISASATPPAVITVTTVAAEYQQVPDELQVTGSVRAVDPLTVGAEVSGLKITSVNVEEGSTVRKGQVLATLNRSILEAQLAQARARYQGSLAQIGKAVQPNRSQDIAVARAAYSQARATVSQEMANLRQAQTNLHNAQRTAQRYTQVLDDGYVTAQEAQDRTVEVARNRDLVIAAEKRLEAARFSAQQAEQRLSLAQEGGRSEDVAIAQSSSGEVAANIQLLEAQLEQTVIRAPDDGLVISRDAHLGDIVSPTKPLFSIARLGQLELKAQVPEADLARIRIGDRAKLSINGKPAQGRVWMISPSVDSTNRLGSARIMIDGGAGRHSALVLPGMYARADLRLGEHRALVVPGTAVLGENDNYFVYLFDGGVAKRQKVVPGVRFRDVVELVEGISPGSSVIVQGAGFIGDGDHVTVAQK